jgi:glyoxylase-like metal-dependent hydrolase (beta-lactamase superfamily II)
VVSASGVEINVLATPGHTEGSSSFYIAGHVFTGDTLFRESIGRFDLSGGDEQKEIASIRNVLFALPEETVVWPGHGHSTSIGHEKIANRFVR